MLAHTSKALLQTRRHGRSKLTGFLLILSLTINTYLLLNIHVKPEHITEPSLEEPTKIEVNYIPKRDVLGVNVKQSDLVKRRQDEIRVPDVHQDVNFEIKNENVAKIKDTKSTNDRNVQNNLVCSEFSKWTSHVINPKTDTNLVDWTFKSKRNCPNFTVDVYPKLRPKVSLHCNGKQSQLVVTETNSTRDIEQVVFGDECLRYVIDNCCRGKKVVPNVVHYIWYADHDLGYFQFISFMSALRFMKPCLILIHGPYIPKGKYWDYFISISPNVIHVLRDKPTQVFGNKFAYEEHASDVMRIEALKAYGGVYLDFDEIILRSLEPLRNYDYTQGLERDVTMGSQLVMARRNATFLNLWYLSYRDDYQKTWADNALWVPAKLAKKYPHLIHVDGYNFTRPNWQNVKLIFKANYDWSTNYGMHMYVRWYKNATNNLVIRTLNTTIGSVARHVLFGNKELCIK